MEMTRERVLALAQQARLGLTKQEADELAPKLQKILQAADELHEVDTAGVGADLSSTVQSNVLRADVVGESLPRENVLAGAPDVQDGMFKVPRLHEQ